VMILLFLILRYVVKRGEEIIETRAQERLKLKEQLGRAERLSSLGEMVASISHEIRNPLGIIRSSAELLRKKMSNDVNQHGIPEIIVEEAARMNSIITDFLNFARPREPDPAACRIDDIIQKNLDFLSPEIEEKGYTVQTACEQDMPEALADADMLYQAFLNLFINAMQAMPEGGNIQVDIGYSENTVVVSIADEGNGIDDELIEKIWDPFVTTKDRGTGLGLGIVKNIIEQHGGSIRMQNREPQGARAVIELPLDQED